MILSCTGHRPDKLGGYNLMTQIRLRKLASAWLERLNPSKVITGMALGWDQAVAWEARQANIPYIAAIPFPRQAQRWARYERDLWYDLLRSAESIEVTTDDVDWNAYQRRNEWMVDNSDKILALWNGRAGGTCNTVLYAIENKGLPFVVNVWTEYVG